MPKAVMPWLTAFSAYSGVESVSHSAIVQLFGGGRWFDRIYG
jgi:hypothetical protein